MLALSGTLDHFMPVQILRFLQMSASTGRLEISHGDERADLFLINGRSAFALTNGVHLRVGDVLVNGGDIRPEAVELTAAFQQDAPGSPIGRMLVETGAVEPARLRAAVLEVQRRIVCRVLLWRDGEFVFHLGERATTRTSRSTSTDWLVIGLRLAGSVPTEPDRSRRLTVTRRVVRAAERRRQRNRRVAQHERDLPFADLGPPAARACLRIAWPAAALRVALEPARRSRRCVAERR